MNIPLPNPVTIRLPDGKTLEYSLPDMARYLARSSKRFGAGSNIEALRMGQRIDEAFANPKGNQVELTDSDWAELLKELRKPSCGWANITATYTLQMGVDEKGQPQLRQVTKRLAVSGLDILPLIDGLPTV